MLFYQEIHLHDETDLCKCTQMYEIPFPHGIVDVSF